MGDGKPALKTAQTHRRLRKASCTFDEMLELTTPVQRTAVIEHYCEEHELSPAMRDQLLSMAVGSVPWFVTLSLTVSTLSAIAIPMFFPPIVVCDPAFVAEMPVAPGVLLKIGHFDQIGGVTHVEH